MKRSLGRRGLAVLLAAVLLVPTSFMPVSAEESNTEMITQPAAEVTFNPGAGYFTVYDWNSVCGNNKGSVSGNDENSVSGNDALLAENGLDVGSEEDLAYFREYFCFDENGSYTISVEPDAFFPYEVEFTVAGEKMTRWFDTPDSTVEVGGHVFGIDSEMTGTQVTGMTLNVAGNSIVLYPEKEFIDQPLSMASTMSLLPLQEKRLAQIDLSGYTPIELTQVSLSALIGSEITTAERIAWKITWDYSGYIDDTSYEVSGTGDKIDLSWNTYGDNGDYCYNVCELIDNNGDQLDGNATRYSLPFRFTDCSHWLTPVAYKKAADGSNIDLSVYRTGYQDRPWNGSYRYFSFYLDSDAVMSAEQIYVKLGVNDSVFSNVNYATLKAFAGEDKNTEITDRLITSGTEGYAVSMYEDTPVILEAYDAVGQVVGTLPMNIYVRGTAVTGLDLNYLYDISGTTIRASSHQIDGNAVTMELYSGCAANETYYWKPSYRKDDEVNNGCVTAAYVGTYATIAEAAAAGAADIKDTLFGSQGYGADYSGSGVAFTIFIGADGEEEQEVYQYTIRAVEQSTEPSLNSGTMLYISGFRTETDSYINTTNAGYYGGADDSYGDDNYFTFYSDKEVDLTKLKMSFDLSSGAKLYAGDAEVKSQETLLDFSNGPIQFTVASEDGNHSKNYWVAVYKPVEGVSKLYINSLGDESAKTEEKDGIVYSTREVMLDSIHDNIHDIMVANLGTLPIAGLKTELSADATVALDGYWQLGGNNSLEGFSDSYGYLKNEDGSFSGDTSSEGKLWNLARVRLVKKDGVEDGTDVAGTLTFKSGETVLMVLNLTGTVGDPTITTKEIPAAVKYVPYGVMIQNSNKYSWNTVTYDLFNGELPAGMTLKKNGELYGVPTESGEYTFTVCMKNSSTEFDDVYREFTLTVVENTDENVDGATDEGYTVLDRVPDLSWNDTAESYDIRSNGAFTEFKDIYLDGVKLTEGIDYTKSEGSTRVTINSQTLKNSKAAGVHTLGMEFREGATESSEGSLKRAAQNYYLKDSGNNNPDGNTPGGDDNPGGNHPDGNGGSGSGSFGNIENAGNTGSAANTAQTSIVPEKERIETVIHTVQHGDTLWKIAARYYHNGNLWRKIYEDNKESIRNPNRLYLGQRLLIYLSGSREDKAKTEQDSTGAVNRYTVKAGDSFWRIAYRYYGDGSQWRRIFKANEALVADPKRLRAGMRIVIPE